MNYQIQRINILLIYLIIAVFYNSVAFAVINNNYSFYRTLKYEIKDIEELPVFICNNKSDCPFYSRGCINVRPGTKNTNPVNICDMSFICHGKNKCKSFESFNNNVFNLNKGNSENGFKFIDKNTYISSNGKNKNNNIILHSCNSNLYKKGYCETENCHKNNTMCLSGYCHNNICLKRKYIKDYICRVNYKDISDLKIECKLSNDEHCTSNEECDSNYCNSMNYCMSHKDIQPIKSILLKQNLTHGLHFLLYFIMYSFIIYSVLIIYRIYKKIKSNNSYKEL